MIRNKRGFKTDDITLAFSLEKTINSLYQMAISPDNSFRFVHLPDLTAAALS
jgi:hypothetical protein